MLRYRRRRTLACRFIQAFGRAGFTFKHYPPRLMTNRSNIARWLESETLHLKRLGMSFHRIAEHAKNALRTSFSRSSRESVMGLRAALASKQVCQAILHPKRARAIGWPPYLILRPKYELLWMDCRERC